MLSGVKVDECHLNKGGVAHGGLHATLLDTAMGGATVSSLSEEEWCATVQLDISYLNAAKVNSGLICTGTVLKRGRSIAHVQGEIRDQEEKSNCDQEGYLGDLEWKTKASQMSGIRARFDQ